MSASGRLQPSDSTVQVEVKSLAWWMTPCQSRQIHNKIFQAVNSGLDTSVLTQCPSLTIIFAWRCCKWLFSPATLCYGNGLILLRFRRGSAEIQQRLRFCFYRKNVRIWCNAHWNEWSTLLPLSLLVKNIISPTISSVMDYFLLGLFKP